MAKSREELTVITKTYELILWSCNHTARFPRNHRFVLGERIERNLYDLLETLIQAIYSRERTPLLQVGQRGHRNSIAANGSAHPFLRFPDGGAAVRICLTTAMRQGFWRFVGRIEPPAQTPGAP